jgi:hypothetical protein
MGNLRSCAVYVAAVAVALAPGVSVLSTGLIGRFLLRIAEMLQPRAGHHPPRQITNYDFRSSKMNASVSDLLEPDGDRLAVRHYLHPHSPAERVTEPTR